MRKSSSRKAVFVKPMTTSLPVLIATMRGMALAQEKSAQVSAESARADFAVRLCSRRMMGALNEMRWMCQSWILRQ